VELLEFCFFDKADLVFAILACCGPADFAVSAETQQMTKSKSRVIVRHAPSLERDDLALSADPCADIFWTRSC